jgi:hypothetical protein
MRTRLLAIAISLLSLWGNPLFSQSEKDTTLLGLPGDNLDLYAVLDLFQKSKTIEDFEKSLNDQKTGINNLDLNLDNKVDFIKVETKKNGDDYTFILQVDVTKTEKQDVAVILVSKDKNKKVTMQIIGDKSLYGKDYIVEPKATTTPAATPNPGYSGADPLKAPIPTTTTTVVIEQTPIVQYVYSPAYVPYVPPYYYGFYPPYFAAFSVMAVGIYAANHSYYHGGYGCHGNTTIVHNTNNYNNYNSSRNSSNTVNHNKANGNYNRNNGSARPSGGGGKSPSTQPANRQAGGGGKSPSTQPANREPGGAGKSPSTQPANRQPGGAGKSPSAQPSNRQSTGSSGSNRQSQPSMNSNSGGNRSGGGGYSGGGRGGGGSRGGGGGRGGGGRR